MSQHVYLQTYGCQMNERDSEEILGMLTAQGYTVVEREEIGRASCRERV